MKKHNLSKQELFDLVELVRHINHWNQLLQSRIGFIGESNGLDPAKGQVKLDLGNKCLNYEEHPNPTPDLKPKKS